ncbi:MAG: YHS domain-containing protein [Nanoarchaeota archaeon]|nr:YHS domain-containing protein [Nanoarchaeota archaeon]
MPKDPICGMNVNEKEAKKKDLVVTEKGKTHYFCSDNCKDKFAGAGKDVKKETVPWYKSEAFGKAFPWVLGIVLIGGSLWSILGGFMVIYMGVFFIVFSLMKMPDWKGFVNAFSMYDVIAKRVKGYAWIYPGIEFVLGLVYLFGIFITGAAWVTLFIMGIGSIGVAKNIFSKNKVKCACLGTKINVPLTKVTLLEDLIMFVMAIMILVGFGI